MSVTVAVFFLLLSQGGYFCEQKFEEADKLLDSYEGQRQIIEDALRIADTMKECGLSNVIRGRAAYKVGYISGEKTRPEALEEANRYFDTALAKEPHLPAAHYYRAFCYSKSGRYQEALDELDKIEKGSYNEQKILYARSSIYLRKGDCAIAEKLAQEAKLRAKDVHLQYEILGILADCSTKKYRYEDARKYRKLQLDMQPNSSWAKRNYCLILYTLGEKLEAAKICGMQVHDGPRVPENENMALAYRNEALKLLHMKKKPKEAILHLRKAVSLNPRDTNIYMDIAQAYRILEKMGDKCGLVMAMSELKKAYEIDKKNLRVVREYSEFQKNEVWFNSYETQMKLAECEITEQNNSKKGGKS